VYDVVEDSYMLELTVDSEAHFMTFEDVPTVLPSSWFGKEARAHQARVIHSLARSAHAACYLDIVIKLISSSSPSIRKVYLARRLQDVLQGA